MLCSPAFKFSLGSGARWRARNRRRRAQNARRARIRPQWVRRRRAAALLAQQARTSNSKGKRALTTVRSAPQGRTGQSPVRLSSRAARIAQLALIPVRSVFPAQTIAWPARQEHTRAARELIQWRLARRAIRGRGAMRWETPVIARNAQRAGMVQWQAARRMKWAAACVQPGRGAT